MIDSGTVSSANESLEELAVRGLKLRDDCDATLEVKGDEVILSCIRMSAKMSL